MRKAAIRRGNTDAVLAEAPATPGCHATFRQYKKADTLPYACAQNVTAAADTTTHFHSAGSISVKARVRGGGRRGWVGGWWWWWWGWGREACCGPSRVSADESTSPCASPTFPPPFLSRGTTSFLSPCVKTLDLHTSWQCRSAAVDALREEEPVPRSALSHASSPFFPQGVLCARWTLFAFDIQVCVSVDSAASSSSSARCTHAGGYS